MRSSALRSIPVLSLVLLAPLVHAGTIVALRDSSSAMRNAVERLSSYTGLTVASASAGEGVLRIELNARRNARIEPQGYTIRSEGKDRGKGGGIIIRANDAEGATNGVFTLLRTLMIEHRKDPFSRRWSVEEKPSFTFRSMQISPYRFGASYGFARLSPDRWDLAQWKDYLDLMRQLQPRLRRVGFLASPEHAGQQRELRASRDSFCLSGSRSVSRSRSDGRMRSWASDSAMDVTVRRRARHRRRRRR